MASPRVFVSSTCYDLSEVRHSLELFIRGVGFVPVLSEKGDVFYHPELHTHQACVKEVSNSNLFVLIIGGRFGGHYVADRTKSVTNAEYAAARELGIPVITFVKQDVWSDHHFYTKNKEKKEALSALTFPSIEKQDHAFSIFDFVDEVRQSKVNNATIAFSSSSELMELLRKQWAGMFFDFLSQSSESRKVQESVQLLTDINKRIEVLSEQILRSVGSDDAKLTAKLYDIMLSYEAIRDLAYIKLTPTPDAVLKHKKYGDLANALGKEIEVEEDNDEFSVSSKGTMSGARFRHNEKNYAKLRDDLLAVLKDSHLDAAEFIKKAEKT
jgi:hypothetical protein